MQVNTSELTGHSLMWAVNQCELTRLVQSGEYVKSWVLDHHRQGHTSGLCPLTALEIIEREKISVTSETFPWWDCEQGWYAHIGDCYARGDTPVQAAMRCYVLKTIGSEVDMPSEIKPSNS